MNSSNSSDGPHKSSEKKRRYLTAEKKFQIYLEAQDSDKPVGELLRREGLYSTDLARIRQQVKEGALQRLSAKPGRQQELVSTEAYKRSVKTRTSTGQHLRAVAQVVAMRCQFAALT